MAPLENLAGEARMPARRPRRATQDARVPPGESRSAKGPPGEGLSRCMQSLCKQKIVTFQKHYKAGKILTICAVQDAMKRPKTPLRNPGRPPETDLATPKAPHELPGDPWKPPGTNHEPSRASPWPAEGPKARSRDTPGPPGAPRSHLFVVFALRVLPTRHPIYI